MTEAQGDGTGREGIRESFLEEAGLGGALKVEEVGVARGSRASEEGDHEECREGEAPALAGLMLGEGVAGNPHVP